VLIEVLLTPFKSLRKHLYTHHFTTIWLSFSYKDGRKAPFLSFYLHRPWIYV